MDIKYKPEDLILMSDQNILDRAEIFMDDVIKMKEDAARQLLPDGFKTAEHVHRIQLSQSKISTGCTELNNMLEGGLERRCITEIYGESGCGKSQFALQTAAHSWREGVVYINTEDTFPSKRLQQLFQHLEQTHDQDELKKYGEKIFILQIKEVEELLKCIDVLLPRLLQANPSINLIILDSIAAPFRGNYENCNISRAEHIKEIGVGLLRCSKLYNLAVLCINQVSAAIESDKILPCLGLVWSNIVTTRINVMKTDKYSTIVNNEIKLIKNINERDKKQIYNVRSLHVIFSPYLSNTLMLEYVILEEGIQIVKK